MKYAGMPMGMWALFAGSFQKQLTAVLGYDAATAKQITKSAKPKYKEIIAKLPEFEKADRFQLNIIGCAMLGAFVLCMPKRPDTEALTVYYENAQMTPLMKWFCRRSGKSKFTAKDIASMKATADLKAADRNPYSWNEESRAQCRHYVLLLSNARIALKVVYLTTKNNFLKIERLHEGLFVKKKNTAHAAQR